MILDDLFEANLPPNIKPSDLPPSMRQRLTMRDVEQERPRSVFRYQVGDKQFMDLHAAQEFARGTRQRVIPIGEEQEVAESLPRTGTPESVGYMYLAALEKAKKTQEPVTLDYGSGNRIRITDPNIKAWFVNRFAEAKKQKNPEYLQAFLINMGTLEGVRALLRRMQQDVPPQKSDLLNKSRAAESRQKKRSEVAEQDRNQMNPRTQRIVDLMRARHPQAKSDSEAMLYDFMAAQKRDRRDIERLEKQRDDLEKDIKRDIEKDIAALKQRRDGRVDVSKIQAKNQQQDQAIQRISQIQQRKDELDREQNKAIDDLEKSVSDQPSARPSPVTAVAPSAAVPAEPAGNRADVKTLEPSTFGGMVKGLTPNGATTAAAPAKTPAKVTQLPIKRATRAPRQQQLPLAAEDAGRSSARIDRILKQLRAKHPQAEDDLEALIYDFRGGQAEDRRDINRLDMENDQEEAELDRLEKIINRIQRRRGSDRNTDTSVAEGSHGMGVRLTRSGPEESIQETKKDACYHKVKSRYKVWPSAYASGALVQCRKKGAANWGNKS